MQRYYTRINGVETYHRTSMDAVTDALSANLERGDTMAYGIGRVPQDVDPAAETAAEIEAERIQPTPRPRQPLDLCQRCGQEGEHGKYPFSTLPGGHVCDDCI